MQEIEEKAAKYKGGIGFLINLFLVEIGPRINKDKIEPMSRAVDKKLASETEKPPSLTSQSGAQ